MQREDMDVPGANLKPAIHFTDKLNILESEKEKAIMEISQMACGAWNSVWTEIRAKTLEFKVSLQRASEKNKALHRLKPRFEGSINENLLTGENRRAIDKQL
ncbi:hypothetical protein AVEN_108256-1 [Araneus ventricosus]|uniref:Uncharacterized protein n=1 Tax=Araneus ventricosus TaxID=182803 RepID=A0A4Y2DWT1_ARAVE|nr:hypothetical protein AVEN_108256-1 [Araneus ventricosus]